MSRPADSEFVLDPIRKQLVALTPEEEVRQRVIQLLMARGARRGRIAVEVGFTYNGMSRRADVIVHDEHGAPYMVVECKAPSVAINQKAFDQVARYNTVLRAPYIMVTNGETHALASVDFLAGTTTSMTDLPEFP